MALALSDALINGMLATASLRDLTDGFFIDVYSGAAPSSPSAAATGTLLCRFTLAGSTPLVWDNPTTDQTLSKPAASWQGVAAATGVAGYFRLYKATDTPTTVDTSKYRIDGTVGTSGADMIVSNTTFTATAVETITSFDVSLTGA